MDKLELAWQTYEFYTNEILKYEEIHVNNIQTLKNLVKSTPFPTRHQKKRMKTKCFETCTNLNQLYNKQVNVISDLIELNDKYVDIPPEREIDTIHLLSLKNITVTLMHEIEKYKSQIEEMLS